MLFKLISLDIDGTLTNSRKRISPKTRDKLIRFQKNGGIVVLASGRPAEGILPHADTLHLREFGGYILAYNGGCAIDCASGDILFQSTMPCAYIPEICEAIRGRNVGINTYEGEHLIVGNCINRYTEIESRINNMPIHFVEDFAGYVRYDVNKCLLQGEPEEIAELEKLLSAQFDGRLGVFKSEPYFLELVPLGIDKAQSIDRLLSMIGIATEECIACGDGYNDISMLRYAGLGVAMANASDTVKRASDYITLSNDEDGIEYLLRELGLLSVPA